MSGYEYGNARLRAMRSRLLSPADLNSLAEAVSLAELIGILTRTPYRRTLEVSLVQNSDLESIDEALRRDFIQTTTSIRRFFDGAEKELVDLFLRAYDVHNLKTVLRGLSHRFARSDIEKALLPVGELSAAVLGELLRASSPRVAIDLLATIRHPFAQPLLALRAEWPGSGLFDMELALERWYYGQAERYLKDLHDDGALARTALNLAADMANLMVVLRFVHAPQEKNFLQARSARGGPEQLFNGSGSLSADRLTRLYGVSSVKSALEMLADTPYHAALQQGLQAYAQSGQLSEIERALRRYQLRWQAWQVAKDPLGIGVFIGYLALKNNEVANLRRIARGIQHHQSSETVRAAMERAL